jgi:molybdenum cofactor guanylyltransferase
MGGGKPMTPLGGRPLISYPLAAARAAELEAVVVAKSSVALAPLGCEVVLEPQQPRHPLRGIVSALVRAGGRAVVVVACDMPFLTGPLLRWLAELDGAAAVELDGRPQPLLARYLHSNLPVLERALQEQLPARAAVQMIGAVGIDERSLARFGDPRRLCFNVNHAGDLALARRWLEDGGSGTRHPSC